jgi:hypothetical protein
MLASLKADLAALEAKAVAVKTYLETHYKQLIAALAVGHYSSIVETVVAWVHKVL